MEAHPCEEGLELLLDEGGIVLEDGRHGLSVESLHLNAEGEPAEEQVHGVPQEGYVLRACWVE